MKVWLLFPSSCNLYYYLSSWVWLIQMPMLITSLKALNTVYNSCVCGFIIDLCVWERFYTSHINLIIAYIIIYGWPVPLSDNRPGYDIISREQKWHPFPQFRGTLLQMIPQIMKESFTSFTRLNSKIKLQFEIAHATMYFLAYILLRLD